MLKLKKLITFVLVVAVVFTMLPAQSFATGGTGASGGNIEAEDGLIYGESGTISRAEWLHNLAVIFDMTVEDENYPDNYFSDLTEDSDYYYDVLLNVQFGVIDVLAGDPIYPDAAVTRDYAATTLNYCLGYQLEDEVYSFSDSEACSEPASAQIAVNRGWFALVDGAFSPDKTVTEEEIAFMMEDAQEVWQSTTVDETHENVYLYSNGVVEVPDGTEVSVSEEKIVSITDCPVTIATGDVFVVYQNSIPVLFEATGVSTQGNTTVVETIAVETNEYIESIDAQGTIGSGGMIFEPVEGVDLVVENDNEMATFGNGTINLSNGTKLTATTTIKLSEAISAKVEYEMKNAKIEYGEDSYGEAFVILTADVDVEYTVEFDSTETIMSPIRVSDKPLFKWVVPGIGGITVVLDLKFSGEITGKTSGKLNCGFAYEKNQGFRTIRYFETKSFSLTVSASAKVGVEARLGITEMPCVQGYVYGNIGGEAKLYTTFYDVGEPEKCTTFSAWLYSSVGAKVYVDFGFIKESLSVEYDIYDEKNSPVRAYHHYEDGQEVCSCTRGVKPNNGYYTDSSSSNWDSGWSDGSGSYGYDRAGNKVAIYEYTLNSSKEAIITKYNGNSTYLSIPKTLDGYTVVEIGQSAFYNKDKLIDVVIPSTVTVIGVGAFYNCDHLATVQLSENLTELACGSFGDCDSLTSIHIPKSVVSSYTSIYSSRGAFNGCNGLSKVTFEEGVTMIPADLFANCPGLVNIDIPETVTTIGKNAFLSCANLTNVTMGDNVTSIGIGAFEDCDSIEEIELSDNLTVISEQTFYDCDRLTKIVIPDEVTFVNRLAFYSCDQLESVTLSNNVTDVADCAFGDCDKIKSIHIPRSLTASSTGIPSARGAFNGCDGLKTVTFEEGVLEIPDSLFAKCPGLEEITIPETVTRIEPYAFLRCENLEDVTMSNNITLIENGAFEDCDSIEKIALSTSLMTIEESAFLGCDSLKEIVLPDSVTTVYSLAFYNCSHLAKVTLSKNVTDICDSAFGNCDLITSVHIPKSLTQSTCNNSYARGVFNDCDGLKTITFEEGVTEIGENVFAYCSGLETITIPETVEKIENRAFTNCSSLREVIFSDNVTTIGDGVFENCDVLETITFGKGLKSIGQNAFSSCDSLETIELPDSVTTVGSNAFYDNKKMTSAKLSNSMTVIPHGMFYKCEKLETVELPEQLITIERLAFYETGLKEIILPETTETIGQEAFKNTDLEKVTLNEGLKRIATSAFCNNDALASVTVPNSVTSLGTSVFEDCQILKDVILGTGITEIPYKAFYQSPALEKIVLPYAVTTVGDNAFANSPKLTEITIPRLTTSIGSSAFSYPTKMTVYGIAGTYAETFANEKGMKFVNQKVNATSVTLSNVEMTLLNGESAKLTMSVEPANFTDIVTWKSADPTIVSVSDTGEIRALQVGTTTIKVNVGDASGSCKVTVVQPVTGVSLNKNAITMNANEAFQLTAYVSPSNANNRGVTWSSSDESVATVDSTGLVTAIGKGTTTITVASTDGSEKNASCTVTVANNYYVVDNVDELESPHKYLSNCTDSWEYTRFGAAKLKVTFSDETCVEDGFDFIYIYDVYGNEIGKYTGDELAGKYVLVPEDTIVIKLVSDAGGNEWGFKVTKIEAVPEDYGEPDDPEELSKVVRVYGGNRYKTSLAIANELKAELGVDKFETIIVASGVNFPDALAGSYLSAKKDAPILMVNEKNVALIIEYIEDNLQYDGTVYLLGGTGAVPQSLEDQLNNLDDKNYSVSRLKGKGRYDTNLAILQEASVTDETILVCTGTNFADSLSGSATGLPILMVNPNTNMLTTDQIAFLQNTNSDIKVIGGSGAVSDLYIEALEEFDKDNRVERIKGSNRYATSVEVAETFFDSKNPDSVIIASATSFPDGLCGGPLAYAMGAPLILTGQNYAPAAGYMEDMDIDSGIALGGTGALANDVVRNVFAMKASETIVDKKYN